MYEKDRWMTQATEHPDSELEKCSPYSLIIRRIFPLFWDANSSSSDESYCSAHNSLEFKCIGW